MLNEFVNKSAACHWDIVQLKVLSSLQHFDNLSEIL